MTIIKHADMALGKNWECVSLNSNEYSQEERSPNMKGRKRSPSCNTANFKLGFKFCTLSSLSKNSTRLGPGHQGGKRNADPPRPQLADPAGHKPVPADDAARASPCRMEKQTLRILDMSLYLRVCKEPGPHCSLNEMQGWQRQEAKCIQ
jgi:hypothetical protein